MNPAKTLVTTRGVRNVKEGHMSDDSVQKEIEANEARVRDTEDVGVDENVVQQRDQEGTIFEDLTEDVLGDDDNVADEKAHEYDDNTKST